MNKIFYILINISFLCSFDQIPAPEQDHPIMLKGGIIKTISNGTIDNGDIVFDEGKIINIGINLVEDLPNLEIIDLNGMYVYPGLISAISTLGLQEIGAVRATRDYSETGSINPNVRANVSYNPDSELIPVSRSNGVLLSLSVPRSGLVSGMSSLMMLDGWTWEDATLKHPLGLHIFWPSMRVSKTKLKNNRKGHLESIQKLDSLFSSAHAYLRIKESSSKSFKHDLRLEGILPVIKGEIPVFIHANEIRQIEAAVFWSDRQNINMVLVGVKDAWRNTQLLVDHNISVVYTQTFSTPTRRFENYDQPYITPLQLFNAKVKFCISNSESPFQTPHIRNLPYYAAKAASYGLPWEEALRSITLSTAEILQVDDRVGSLEKYKDATLIISDGDILDVRTNVISAYIEGRKIDLSDRHKMLYSKYKQKYQQINILKK